MEWDLVCVFSAFGPASPRLRVRNTFSVSGVLPVSFNHPRIEAAFNPLARDWRALQTSGGMPTCRLSYNQMLGELNQLLGEFVAVSFSVSAAGERPLGLMAGRLGRAEVTDLSALGLKGAHLPPGESLQFMVTTADQVAGHFLVTKATFKVGRKYEDGALSFMSGWATITITRPELET